MGKKIFIIVLIIVTALNTLIAGFQIFNIEERTENLLEKENKTRKLNYTLYDVVFLDSAILQLETAIINIRNSNRNNIEYNALAMTEEVLFLLKENRIKVISYRLEGEENAEELVVTGEGNMDKVLKLLYDFSYSDSMFRISFLSVDNKMTGRAVSLVIRITCDFT